MTEHESTQSLHCSFRVPSRHTTTVQVTLEPNKHPAKVGSCLIFPEQPIDDFVDFPVCNAKIKATEDRGYAAIYGWIQMVREAPLSSQSTTTQTSDFWEMDPIPMTADLENPFILFGPEAQLFDAPFRSNRTDMDWTCWSFLTYIKDSLMSKSVRPILVIEWGFQIDAGNVTIKTLRLIDVQEAWEQQREMLEQKFGSWSFEPADEHLEVSQISGQSD
ncbi:hypothetical protein KCU99_g6474, partial [Aureobasidium melanogenum]